MRSQYLVLRPEFEQLKCLNCRLTFENVEVLHDELVFLGPPDPEALHIFLALYEFLSTGEAIDAARVQQIENLFIVDLQKGDEHSVMAACVLLLEVVDLLEELANALLDDPVLRVIKVPRVELSLVSLHRECLTATCLAVREDGPVVPFHHLIDELRYAQAVVDLVLGVVLVEYMVEVEKLSAAEASCNIHTLVCTFFWLLNNLNRILLQLNFGALMAFLVLDRQQGPYSDRDLDPGPSFEARF